MTRVAVVVVGWSRWGEKEEVNDSVELTGKVLEESNTIHD